MGVFFYGILHLTNMLHLFPESYFVFGPNPLVFEAASSFCLRMGATHWVGQVWKHIQGWGRSTQTNMKQPPIPVNARCILHLLPNEWNWMHCEKKKRLILDEEEMLQPECQLWKTAPRPVRSFPCNTASSHRYLLPTFYPSALLQMFTIVQQRTRT